MKHFLGYALAIVLAVAAYKTFVQQAVDSLLTKKT